MHKHQSKGNNANGNAANLCHPVELAFYRTGSHLVRIGIAVPLSQRRARVIVRRLLRRNDEYDEYAKDA